MAYITAKAKRHVSTRAAIGARALFTPTARAGFVPRAHRDARRKLYHAITHG